MSEEPGLPATVGAGVVLAAHGTRDPAGRATTEEIRAGVAARLGEPVDVGWIQLARPELGSLLRCGGAEVVVPLLLGTGYHLLSDIPAAVAGAGGHARTTAHLGPHQQVLAAVADRLRAVDPHPSAVVLAAAGTSHPVGRSEVRQAADVLADLVGCPVSVAHASGQGPDVAEAVDRLRGSGASRVSVVPYLLAPGFFALRIAEAAASSGAACAEVIGAHPGVVDLVVQRVRQARRAPMHREGPADVPAAHDVRLRERPVAPTASAAA